MRVDLMVLPPEHYGALLHHFTGSREHNIQMRDRALNRGLKLNEYGFDRPDGTRHPVRPEEEVFATLGLPYIPPELREGAGEIETAAVHRLPTLVTVADIKGDLHNHSKWSDGQSTIEEMARAAQARGYEYMAITDHSQSLTIARGMTVEQIRAQAAEVAEVNRKLAPFRVLHGVELEIKTRRHARLPGRGAGRAGYRRRGRRIRACGTTPERGHRARARRLPQPARGYHRPPHRPHPEQPRPQRPGRGRADRGRRRAPARRWRSTPRRSAST